MKEQNREVKTLNEDLEAIRKKAAEHDKALRWVDGFLSKVVEEFSIKCNQVPSAGDPPFFPPFEKVHFTADMETFVKHLEDKGQHIVEAIHQILLKLPDAKPDSAKLEARISELLTAEKGHVAELARLREETASLDERLENASMRYMMAEKKVDRLRSVPVQKLEAQAKQPPKSEVDQQGPSDSKGEESKQVNGILPEYPPEASAARQEAVAARDKIKEQLDRVVEENRKLTDNLTTAQAKYATLSDEDYSKTELYTTLRAQHEDTIKRVNDLQVLNNQVREEMKKLHAERAQYKEDVEKEQESAIKESESQVAKLSADLVRIRNERDNVHSDLLMARAEQKDVFESSARSSQLAASTEERISALESENDRLRVAAEGKTPESDEELSQLDTDSLVARLRTAEQEKRMLNTELSSMATAYKKAQASASQKLANTVDAEERVARAVAEKTKADQKFFQTMKTKESQATELKAIKAKNTKTSEVVSTLRDTESHRKNQIMQNEKQIAELRDNLASVEKSYRDLQQREYDLKTKAERVSSQAEELKKQLSVKDDTMKIAQQSARQAESDSAEFKVRLDEAEKSVDVWRKRSMGANNDEYDMLKQIATCTICRKNFKEVALTKCGHVFCQACVDERYNSRARKCPNCGSPFGQNDKLRVTL